MQDAWIISPTGRRVAAHAGDSHPAWLWSGDGESLIWHNEAARAFALASGKRAQRGASMAVPIRGQIARLIRLGTTERASLARIQLLVGKRPISTTCLCTPLSLPNGAPGMLIVGVDAVADVPGEPLARLAALLPDGMEMRPRTGETDPALSLDTAMGELALVAIDLPGQVEPAPAPEETALAVEESLLPRELAPLDEAPAPETSLTALFDRLAMDEALFETLGDEPEDIGAVPTAPEENTEMPEETTESEPAVAPLEDVAPPAPPRLFRLIARRLLTATDDEAETVRQPEPAAADARSIVETASLPADEEIEDEVEASPASPAQTFDEEDGTVLPPADDEVAANTPTPETVERVSRYNFDELSRILADRVGLDASQAARETEGGRDLGALPATSARPGDGALVSLGSETIVLNRLPLGILVFRDQQVLFANRAITEMIGYDSVENLRKAGLAAIFPAAGDEQTAGPVNHLVQRDGTLVPVTARLQSVAWQGRPALMLSASTTEVRTGHEAAVRAFAEMLAEGRGDGFIEATRNGMISGVSAAAARMIGRSSEQIIGRSLLALVADDEDRALKAFLERPARFAETVRPALSLRSSLPETELQLYAQGQAGVITGYFGFLHQSSGGRKTLPAEGSVEPALLSRVSRGLRQPLNTIVGFSELIRSAAFGPIDNPRYAEYARDILSAGQEITSLVDELDDYARLKDGRYQPRTTVIDLGALLDSCVVRIRAQAGAARVLVRSAISETLPRVMADRASLGQAVLNLLSSAIDQTPAGAAVVLSAQQEDDGAILIHVREQGAARDELGDGFVVFRDGAGTDGRALVPVRSSMGLALTRSLLEVNSASLSVEATHGSGTLFALRLPPETVVGR